MALDPMAKDPGSASCETLVMKIKLPGVDSAAKLDLDVTAKRVRLRSAKYALSEPLQEWVVWVDAPHPRRYRLCQLCHPLSI